GVSRRYCQYTDGDQAAAAQAQSGRRSAGRVLRSRALRLWHLSSVHTDGPRLHRGCARPDPAQRHGSGQNRPADALTLGRLHPAGELTPVWVPDTEQEAMRDLTRAREALKAIESWPKV